MLLLWICCLVPAMFAGAVIALGITQILDDRLGPAMVNFALAGFNVAINLYILSQLVIASLPQ